VQKNVVIAPNGNFLQLRDEEHALLVSEEVIERDTSFLRHQDPLPNLGLDNELLSTAKVERYVEDKVSSDNQTDSDWRTVELRLARY